MHSNFVGFVTRRSVLVFLQVTSPYYSALFSLGKDKSSVEAFHAGLESYELALKDRGAIYFGGMLTTLLYKYFSAAGPL